MILGLDLSLNSTGLFYIDPKATDNKHGALLSTPEASRGIDRLMWLEGNLGLEILRIGNVHLVVMEGYSYGARNQAHQVGEWGGIARLLLRRRNIRTVIVTPNSLKQFATGNGIAPKEAVKLGVYKRWGLEFESNDVTDACVLAMMGLALDHQEVYEYLYGSLTAVQHKALAAMKLYFAPVEVRSRSRMG